MYGLGLFKGLGVTMKHFVDTYTQDLKWLGTRYTTPTFALRQGSDAKGVFTVEYPDEKIAVPERFRFIPFLVVNNYDDPYAPGEDWCTSCGICAKVCPPQCIWIVRGSDPNTGRPVPQPEAFYIDIDICMNCGYCAEYCPFDAIKMDHDYELASYDRTTQHVYDKQKLSKETRYWQTIAPNRIWEEAEERGFWEHTDVKKAAKKAGIELPAPTEENMYRATTVLVEDYERQAAAAPAAATGAPAAISAASGGSTAPAAQGDPVAIAGDASQPLNVRAAAALQIKTEGAEKVRKLSSGDRKLIAAVQTLAKEQGTTIEDLAASAGDISQVAASAAPAAPAPAAEAPAPAPTAEPVAEAAPASGGDVHEMIARAKDLEAKGKAKEIKLTGDDRRFISAAKKAANEAGIEY
jgi:NADH-quinone oxidoreductase subunit I